VRSPALAPHRRSPEIASERRGKGIRSRRLQVIVLAALLLLAWGVRPGCAQDLTPRAYVIAPVGTNAVILQSSELDGSLQFNGSVPIADARASVNLPALSYYRSFDLLGRTASLTASVPYGTGHFTGTVAEAPRSADLRGFLDSSLRASVNLIGGPAMRLREFAGWRQGTLLGVSLKIVAPTGQYDPTRLLNWGSNRWAFRPEIGYSQRWGHWLLDAYASIWFFTRNPEFFSHNDYYPGARSRSEAPVSAFEMHVSYDFRPRLWVSFDANFWRGGRISLNGIPNPATNQKSSRVGLTASVPLTGHQSVKLSFSDGAYARYGGNYRSISLGWQYAWISK
jgi:Putative MetA-pathway of phenol degradation